MVMTIEVKGLKGVGRFLSGAQKKQVPFATSLAINNTAKSIKAKIESNIKKVFDRPTPKTQKSLFFRPSTKKRLRATVEIKDFVGKGAAPSEYLQHHVEGGKRRFKRSEIALHRRGILPRGWYTMLADDAKRNKHGNMTGGQYTKMLSGLRSLSEVGFSGNLGKGRRAVYFSTPQGVFKRTGKKTIKHILFFTQKVPHYKKRLPIHSTARKVYDKEYILHFDRAFALAMRTAR